MYSPGSPFPAYTGLAFSASLPQELFERGGLKNTHVYYVPGINIFYRFSQVFPTFEAPGITHKLGTTYLHSNLSILSSRFSRVLKLSAMRISCCFSSTGLG